MGQTNQPEPVMQLHDMLVSSILLPYMHPRCITTPPPTPIVGLKVAQMALVLLFYDQNAMIMTYIRVTPA